jgi:hypothetical protein
MTPALTGPHVSVSALKPSTLHLANFCTTIDPSCSALVAIQHRFFDSAPHDVHANLLVAAELQVSERLRRANEGHTAARDDSLFDGRLRGVHRVFDSRFLFLHLSFAPHRP